MGLAKGNYNPMVKKKCSKDFSLKMSRVLLIILCKQLLHIREITEHSKLIASRYLANINCRLVSHFPDAGSDKVVLGRYPLLTESKSLLIKKARQAQIELSGWYSSPVHPLKDDELSLVYYKNNSCPEAEKRCNEIITLPTNQYVRDRDINKIIDFFKKVSI